MQVGKNEWRRVVGVICDRKATARMKGKVYRTRAIPAMLFGGSDILSILGSMVCGQS